jgi:hypothetical protein
MIAILSLHLTIHSLITEIASPSFTFANKVTSTGQLDHQAAIEDERSLYSYTRVCGTALAITPAEKMTSSVWQPPCTASLPHLSQQSHYPARSAICLQSKPGIVASSRPCSRFIQIPPLRAEHQSHRCWRPQANEGIARSCHSQRFVFHHLAP